MTDWAVLDGKAALPEPTADGRCFGPGCHRLAHCRGMCMAHYGQWWRCRPLSVVHTPPWAPRRGLM